MDKINVREHIVVDGFLITEAQADQLQKETNISQKVAKYMMKRWQLLQQASSKEEFAREFMDGMKALLKLKQAAGQDNLVRMNLERLMSTWRLALTTDKAKELGVSMRDFRAVKEQLGFDHASIGRADDKSPKDM